ncbi:uncharacterized protein [Temnothorax nylanderi]|uniref:uncharacterized protein n=1 Tax=Temnothorax nylanderi TaxID=102681 RepID=UPI003A861A78
MMQPMETMNEDEDRELALAADKIQLDVAAAAKAKDAAAAKVKDAAAAKAKGAAAATTTGSGPTGTAAATTTGAAAAKTTGAAAATTTGAAAMTTTGVAAATIPAAATSLTTLPAFTRRKYININNIYLQLVSARQGDGKNPKNLAAHTAVDVAAAADSTAMDVAASTNIAVDVVNVVDEDVVAQSIKRFIYR